MRLDHKFMRVQHFVLIFLLLTLTVTPVYADDFKDGLDAAKKGDYKTALEKWKPLAEQGLVEAQINLGKMYHDGKGVAQDYKEAVKWFWRWFKTKYFPNPNIIKEMTPDQIAEAGA